MFKMLSILVMVLFSLSVYGISFGEELAPNDEDRIVKEIVSAKDDSKLFIIKEFKPKVDGLSGRFTLKPRSPELVESDAQMVSQKSFGGGYNIAYGCRGMMIFSNDIVVDTEFSQDKFYILSPSETDKGPYSSDNITFSGRGSIHRFNGEVKRDGFKFIGEGDKQNRLTFILFDKGYVYVRGKGKVIFPDGRDIKLGY